MMHLFVLSRDPNENVQLHNDTDVLAQCLHLMQLLLTIHKLEGETVSGISLSPFSESLDPLTVWGRETAANYSWIRRNLKAFLDEYQYRWGDDKNQRHASWRAYELLKEPPRKIRARSLEKPFAMTPFPVPSAFRKARWDSMDVVLLHQMLYSNSRGLRPKKTQRYTKRLIPVFMLLETETALNQ